LIYFDTSYVARLYVEDPGWEKVRALAATDHLGCCIHGRAELVAAFHRKFREGILTQPELRDLLKYFDEENEAGAFEWLPMSPAVVDRVTQIFRSLGRNIPLRAADAIHLGCAAENQFGEIYSNDERLLAAARHFGIKGVNIL
jgi:predicted nucleic acid-binding protein